MTESQLRAYVVAMAHQQGWRVFSLPIAKTRRPVKDASGYPDLTLARLGRVLWIELKQDDGVLSPQQMGWLRDLGQLCSVIRPHDLESGAVARLLA